MTSRHLLECCSPRDWITVIERRDSEQYFFDSETADALADFLEPLGCACLLCAPTVGVELEDRGCAPVILDLNERFSGLRGFRHWDIARPTRLPERFGIIFSDPPFFTVSLSQLFAAVKTLAHFDFEQRVAITYLVRREAAFLAVFAPFRMKRTTIRPTYATVETMGRNEIALFTNFEPESRPC